MENVVAYMSIYDKNIVCICLAFYNLENIHPPKKPTLIFFLEGEYLMKIFYSSDSLVDSFYKMNYNSISIAELNEISSLIFKLYNSTWI